MTSPPSESETQRKAHAKRVRETRRSTQGISADDVSKAKDQIQKQLQSVLVGPSTTPSSQEVSREVVNSLPPVVPSTVTSTTGKSVFYNQWQFN